MAQRLAAHMRIARVLRVVISPWDGPASFGWWRPVIVLPAAMMGLPPDQLRVIIAHELAHVRRYDYVVNLCQVIIETLCFYHPAVWWASYRVRVERELCCDDAAVAVCGNAVDYARALTAIARFRLNTPAAAVGATTGPLTRRVARLLGMEPAHCPPPWMPVATGVILVAVLVSAQTWLHAQPAINAPGIVNGTVYDPFGQPAESVLLVLVRPPASLPARSDAAGHFAFTGLTPGRYILTTPATDFFTPREIQVSAAGDAAVAVRLATDETAVNIRVCRDCKPDWFKLPALTTGVPGDAGSHAIVSAAQPAEGWDAFNQRPLAYPPALRTSKTEGTVDIEGTITADGNSSHLRVASSDDAALNDAALSLVQSQRWEPARVRSTAVPVPLHATVEFTLNGD